MLLGRQGVGVEPLEKRLLYASFILSVALVILVTHAAASGAVFAPDGPGRVEAGAAHFVLVDVVRLGVPTAWVRSAGPALLIAYLGVTAVVLVRMVRRAGLRAVAPGLLVVVTQSTWFTLPSALMLRGVDLHDTLTRVKQTEPDADLPPLAYEVPEEPVLYPDAEDADLDQSLGSAALRWLVGDVSPRAVEASLQALSALSSEPPAPADAAGEESANEPG